MTTDELFASEEFVRALVGGVSDGIFMVDLDGCFLFVNDFIAQSSGFPKEAFIGRSCLELIGPEHRELTRRNFDRVLAGEDVPPFELAYHTESGQAMWVEINCTLVSIAGQPRGVVAISRNLQIRKSMEEELRESEEKYRTLVEALPHMIAIMQDSRLVFANEAARRTFGIDDDLDHGHAASYAAAPDRERFGRLFDRRIAGETVPDVYQVTLVDVESRELPVEVHTQPVQFRGRPATQYVITDLSERRGLEQQLQHAQKMEAVGVLAGGIAHDFNNLLTAILATADMMRRGRSIGKSSEQAADLIYRAARQSAGLTQQLLGFARKSNPERRAVNIDRLVDELCEMLDRTLGKEITIVRVRDDTNLHALGDAVQLQQVLMNLVVNARDAMPSGGPVVIRTRRSTLDDPTLLDAFGLTPGPFLRIDVQDAGAGIPPEARDRIFEPFFTTKPEGMGSGMGLAVVYGILRAHGAAISVESNEGRGTVMTVYLPPALACDRMPERQATPRRGKGIVLVVDDEPLLRQATSRLLEALGYDAIVCDGGHAAVERFRQDHDKVDLALVDVRMPLMSGWECVRALRRIAPDLPVVMTSGHGRTGDEPPEASELDFLAKPYDLESLAAALARHLM